MTIRFSLVVLRTAQPEILADFYRQLGMGFSEERHGKGPKHLTGKVGDVVFEIYPLGRSKESDRDGRIGFRLPKLDEVMEKLRSRGVVVDETSKATPWGYRAIVRDPDGRAVELYQAAPEG